MKPTLLFVAGAALVAGGAALIYIPAGLIVAGAFALGGSALTALAEVARSRADDVDVDDQAHELEPEQQPELAEAAAA